MYVIGTAGHVDHGKSALVRALTGIDPDRLREEKERGLTIDLGFAWLTLAEPPTGPGRSAIEISIVDVPGHERFVRNMLAGAGGIDLALLVVAADEGVMPQTREHLAILDLLGVAHGVVALTKRDLVDEEMALLVELEVRETLDGTTLAGAPIVACSSVTRAGLDDLVASLARALEATPRRRNLGRPRMPIDRAFTMAGFGTVVTGTLIDGELSVGDTVELVPGGLRARIRGLQTHRTKVEHASPGRRVAANLAGISPAEVERGMTLTTPGWLRPTTAIDLRLRTVRELRHPLRHGTRVTLHSGSAEAPGTLRLLDADALGPAEDGWAQVRLDREIAVVRGDRCVLRVAGETAGGGIIVEAYAPRRRRQHPPALAALEAALGGPEEALLGAAMTQPFAPLSELATRLDLSGEAVLEAARTLAAQGRAVALPHTAAVDAASMLLPAETVEAWIGRITTAVADYHDAHPLRAGIPKEELRTRLRLESRPFVALLALLAARDVIREEGRAVALASFSPRLTPGQEEEARAFIESLRAHPFAPPAGERPEPDVMALLEARGDIVVVADGKDGIAFDSASLASMLARITAMLRERHSITLADVRDEFATSRRYAQAVLEEMDRRALTRRDGDTRTLVAATVAPEVRS